MKKVHKRTFFKDKNQIRSKPNCKPDLHQNQNTNTGAHGPCQRLLMLTYNQLQCRIPTQTHVFSITEINRMDHIYLLPADYPSAHLHVLYLCTHAATPSPFPINAFQRLQHTCTVSCATGALPLINNLSLLGRCNLSSCYKRVWQSSVICSSCVLLQSV